jgi:hypothetical protein
MYGASNSGKTTLLLDILNILKSHIPNIIVFAQSADMNNSFEGVAPERLIMRECTIAKIEEVFARQKKSTAAYNMANDVNVLESVFARVAGKVDKHRAASIVKMRDDMLEYIASNKMGAMDKNKQTKEIKLMSEQYLRSMYKSTIRGSMKELSVMKLSKTEARAVKFINFNPNLIIIFDDCSSVFTKKFQKSKVMLDLFYMGRHMYTTILFTFHDDTGLEAYLRKNAAMSIFTTAQCASAYFTRSSNSFSTSTKNTALDMIQAIYGESSTIVPEFSKMAYVRNDTVPLRYTLARVHVTFKFGSRALWDMCDKIDRMRRAAEVVADDFGNY